MPILPLGLNADSYTCGTNVYLITGDKVVFNKASSEPATRWGVLDMYRTHMLATLCEFKNGFPIVYKEK